MNLVNAKRVTLFNSLFHLYLDYEQDLCQDKKDITVIRTFRHDYWYVWLRLNMLEMIPRTSMFQT